MLDTDSALCPAVLTRMKVVAGAEQETQLLEGETLRSEVRYEEAVLVVLTELAAGSQIWYLTEVGEKVVGPDNTGLVLQPAGVGGELGLDQDQGRDEEGQRQESQHHDGWWVLVKTEELCAGRDLIQISLIVTDV